MCTVVMLVGLGRSAFADEAPDVPHRSETTATALSVAGTLVPIATFATAYAIDHTGDNGALDLVMTTSVLVGLYAPSLGNAYAGHAATAGLATRIGGGLAFLVGASMLAPRLGGGEDNDTLGAVFCASGLAMYAGGAIYDIATASRDARQFNDAHAPHVQLAPLVAPHARGLALAGTF